MQCISSFLKPFLHNITVLRSATSLKMSKNIPDRWIPYKACGKVIEGTRIICFKVPLRKGVQVHNKAIKEIWDIKALLKNIPNLGGVVDLTNTARYYSPADLQTAGVLYRKILMPGRVIPPDNKVTKFMDTIDEFLGKNCVAVQAKRAKLGLSSADILIGVHCTHGLNRTGYMVCRYMRDRLGIAAEDAIKRFETARGYKIERDNYIADLLGHQSLPPDVGVRETKVRPLHKEAEPEVVPRPRRPKSRKETMEYRSPLEEDQEEYEERSYGYRNKHNNRYNKNGNGYENKMKSSRSSSRWDMSGISHRPHSFSYKHDY